jgi:putative endonuclease
MIMFFYVYTIHSKKSDTVYTGYTTNLIRRVKEHNLGVNRATKPYKPWRLIYYEACTNRIDAKRRETYLKTSEGGRLLKRRLREYFSQQLRFA